MAKALLAVLAAFVLSIVAMGWFFNHGQYDPHAGYMSPEEIAITHCDSHDGLRQIVDTNIGHIAQCNELTPDGLGYWGFPY